MWFEHHFQGQKATGQGHRGGVRRIVAASRTACLVFKVFKGLKKFFKSFNLQMSDTKLRSTSKDSAM